MQYNTIAHQQAPQSDNKLAMFAGLAVAGCVALGVVATVSAPAQTNLYAPATTTVRPVVRAMPVPVPRQVAQTRYEPVYASADYQDAEPVQYQQYVQQPAQATGFSSSLLLAPVAAVAGALAYMMKPAAAPQKDWSMMMAAASPELFEKVKAVVVEELGIDADQATPDANVTDLGADSLDLVELIMRLEEEFDIEIPEELAVKITTVQEAADAVAQQQA